MERRSFCKTATLISASALIPASSEATIVGTQSIRLGNSMPSEPTVFSRDDGRHAAGFDQFEPPLAPGDITLTIDQLADSGIDTLLFAAGVEGGMVIYDSRVAQKLGDNVTTWSHPVHYRDARHIRQIVADGHDRMKMLCDRSHEKGIWFIPSLCIDIATYISPLGHGRTSDFVFKHPQFQVGPDKDPRATCLQPTRFSFLHPEVRLERFRIFEELLSRFETDGVEVWAESGPLCRLDQVRELTPLLTQWLRDLRRVGDKAGESQRRRKRIFVTLPAKSDSWPLMGYDVATWIKEKLVDGLICTSSVSDMHDQDLDLARGVELARGTACRVIAACHAGVARQKSRNATQPMIWAAAANAYAQGANGFALDHPHWFGWPWLRDEYETFRILGEPQMLETADKLYRIRSGVKDGTYESIMLGIAQPLPRLLEVARPVTVRLRVADNLQKYDVLGRVKSVRLRVRVTNLDASRNEIRVVLNGRELDNSGVVANDLTYRITEHGVASPYGYIFEYALPADQYPKQGYNEVALTLVRKDPDIDFSFELFDVDCLIEYRLHRHFENRPIEY